MGRDGTITVTIKVGELYRCPKVGMDTTYGQLWLYIGDNESVQVVGFYNGNIEEPIERFRMVRNPMSWYSRPNARQREIEFTARTTSLTNYGIKVVDPKLQPEIKEMLKKLGCNDSIEFYDGKSELECLMENMP